MNVVAHNISAMNSQNQYKINTRNQSKTAEKLSSGYRINRAGDDAAGLAISEKMRQMVRGLNRASQNVQEGISFVQTADGALAEVTDMLQRINELAVQAANGTESDSDRQFIDREVQQLKTEMNRIFDTTTFNGTKIWGDEGRVGTSVTEVVQKPIVKYGKKTTQIDVTNENKLAIPSDNPEVVADETGYYLKWTGWKSDGTKDSEVYKSKKVAWDETNYTGTHIIDLQEIGMDDTNPSGTGQSTSGINMKFSFTVNQNTSFKDAKDDLNGKKLPISYPENANLQLNGTGTFSKVNASITYAAQLKYGRDFNSTTGDDLFIEAASSNNVIAAGESTDLKINFEGYARDASGTVSPTKTTIYTTNPKITYWDPSVTRNDGKKGDWWSNYYVNGREITTGTPSSVTHSVGGASISSIKSTIKGASYCLDNNNGGDELKYGISFSLSDGSIDVGSFEVTSNTICKTEANAESLLASFNSSSVVDLSAYGKGNYSTSKTATYDAADSSQMVDVAYTINTLVYDPHDMNIQSGAETGEGTILQYPDLNINALGIEYLRTHPQAMALLAMEDISKAIQIVIKSRSLFGAYQNRLESTLNIDKNTGENTQAAESQIRDTDMAKTMVEYSKGNILSQASQAMLSQANTNMESVLALLQ